MKIMDDKEVGELWHKYQPWSGLHGIELQSAKDNCALIRKLVDERAARLYERAPSVPYSVLPAPRDFGIDPATWHNTTP